MINNINNSSFAPGASSFAAAAVVVYVVQVALLLASFQNVVVANRCIQEQLPARTGLFTGLHCVSSVYNQQ